MTTLRLLHVEDDPDDAELILHQLRRDGVEVESVRVVTADGLRAQLAHAEFDVVLCDHVMPGFGSQAALAIVREQAPDVPFIVVSGKIGEEEAVEALRSGAVDYVWKDRLGRLAPAIERAIEGRSERRRRIESEARFRLAVIHQLDAFVIYSAVRDDQGEVVDLRFEFVNQAACEVHRLAVEEQVGHGLLEVFPSLAASGLFARFVEVVESGDPLIADGVEYGGMGGDEAASVFIDVRVIKHGDGCVASFRDVTGRHQAEERAQLVTRLYATLSRVNEAIVVARDRDELFGKICDAAVTEGGAGMAWIGEVDEATGAVRVAARVGHSVDLLDGLEISARDVPEGQGPTGRAIREGRHVLAPDLADDARTTPWLRRLLECGFMSLAGFPLRCGERVIGALTLYAFEPRFFHEEEVALLDQLAADVSYALEALDRDRRRRAAERELERSATLLAEGEELAGFGCWEWDVVRDDLLWSDGLDRLLGTSPEAPRGWSALAEALDPSGIDQLRGPETGVYLEQLRRGEPVATEKTLEIGAARVIVALAARPIRDERGDLIRVVGTAQDVTTRRRAEQGLWLRSRLLDAVDAGVIVTDFEGLVMYWNAGATELYGWTAEEATGREIGALLGGPGDSKLGETIIGEVTAHGAWEGTVDLWRKDGAVFPSLVHSTLLRDEDGAPQGIIGVGVDVTDRVAAERELREAHDFLGAVTEGMGEGLLTVDAEQHITYVNHAAQQMLGWDGGELLGRDLREAVLVDGPGEASRVLSQPPSGQDDRWARSDEFRRRDGTRMPVAFTASPMQAGDSDDERGWVIVFSDDSERRAECDRLEHELEALGWVGRIRTALAESQLVLFAQPIVDIASGRVVQHELLVRMRGEDGAIIPPGDFLPIAERYGLIKDVDRWVVERGIELACAGHPVEINLSAQTLGDREMASWLEDRIRASGVDPALLVFEVTETALLADEAAGRWFASRLALLGCRLALDDFGTGYGGFTYLKQLHVDTLKIDIEFVRDLISNPASHHVVTAVVSLGKGFGLDIVAEGVEDQATLEALAKLGVDMGQGYHLGRPAPVEDVFLLSPQLLAG